MKIHFTLLFSLFSLALFAQVTIDLEYFASGKADIKEYKRNANGRWVKLPFYRELHQDGKVVVHHKNGKLAYTTTAVSGKKEGAFVSYYSNGNIEFATYCKQNKIVGIANYYYHNGQLQETLIYNPNTKDKESLPWQSAAHYTIDGKKLNPGTLKDGNGTRLLYFDDGELYYIITYKNGIRVDELSHSVNQN